MRGRDARECDVLPLVWHPRRRGGFAAHEVRPSADPGCSSCGAALAPDARFCRSCGAGTEASAGARRPELAAAWGALVGPVWAISLALLSAMHVKIVGQPDGESLFGIYLLGGAILGAIGGLLSSQAAQPGVDGRAQHG